MGDTFDDEMSWSDVLEYVVRTSIVDISQNASFISTLFTKAPDAQDDKYLSLIEVLVDMLHDHHRLSSSQRKHATQVLMQRRSTLQARLAYFDEVIEPHETAYAPGVVESPGTTQHTTGGATGPYPVPRGNLRGTPSRGRTPSVTEASEPRTPRASSVPERNLNKSWMQDYRARREQALARPQNTIDAFVTNIANAMDPRSEPAQPSSTEEGPDRHPELRRANRSACRS